ncbi:MAG: pantetheine-phosphate adenylyltransferase [Firmicutes bacterium]|nr:pantetheine-phosphate adenylyltransferase [Clostridiales bacterium]MBQ4340358.1 pantetheine-phosphate adenylyltransferase [Bacillota bacterium]
MKKILYSGTFDPLTKGHLDLIKRGSKLADELIVGIIRNPNKNPMFSIEERKQMIEAEIADLPNVKVDCFEGLLVDYVRENNIDAVLRGLRATMDFEYEIQMAQVNAKLHKDMETIFLMTDERYSYISSSVVREVYALGGEIIDLVPNKIYDYMINYKK